MYMWGKRDEWMSFSNCGGSADHTLPPTRTKEEEADKPVADVRKVVDICSSCRVRPECIEWALGKDQPYPPMDVWAAGKFIPINRGRAKRVRAELAASLDAERAARGDDI